MIVASILLAFGVDAWWESVQEMQEEQQLLSALAEDFRGNRTLLDEVIETHTAASEVFQTFSLGPERVDTASQEGMVAVLEALYGSRTFDPFQGTLEATISSGKLDLLRDAALRTALAEWGQATNDMVENATQMREAAERVRQSMEPYGGPFRGPGPPRMTVLDSIDAPTLMRVMRDDVVMGRARTKQFALEIYLVELVRLRSMAERILALVERNAR